MSYPQNGKQENELETEIVMVFVQETSKHILRYYHIDSIFKRGGGKEIQKTKFKTLSIVKQFTDQKHVALCFWKSLWVV